MSGFWKFTSNYTSRVTKILENDDIHLEDLLDERETVPELLASNANLIEYLRRPEILEKLVEFVVEDDEYQRKEIQLDLEERQKLESQNSCLDNNGEDNTIINGVSNDEIIVDEKEKETHDDNNKVSGAINLSYESNNLSDEDDSTHIVDENVEKIMNDDHENEESRQETEEDNDDDDDHNNDNSDSDDDDDDDDDDFGDNMNEEETEVEKHTRRAQVAAEILSTDVWSITDAFMESIHLLQKLWCILDKPAPLPIFSATYFMKINEHLLDMKTDEMIQFILNEPNLVERFMRHIETPPLMDFLLKVISTDKPDDSTGIIDVLKDQGLIPSLISFLSSEIPSSIQSAAGDFLKAFITISANNAENTTIGPNELTRELVSEPMVRLLVEMMLQGGTGLSNGVGIVIEIIRKNNSDYDTVPLVYVTIESHPPTPRDPIYLGTLVKIFAEKLPEFNQLLSKNIETNLPTPFGSIEPLGFERFKICELVAELIHCSNMALLNDTKGEELVKERDEIRELLIQKHNELMKRAEIDSSIEPENADISQEIENLRLSKQKLNEENAELEESNVDGDDELNLRKNPVVGDQLKIALYDNKIIVKILDMFFKFPWNNFLHNVVFDIVQQILNATMEIGYNKFLAVDLFDRCQITKLIVNGHNNCMHHEEETGLRLGYMGHLSLIAEEVVKFISLDIHHTTNRSDIIDQTVDDDEWKVYVDETLSDIRNKYNAVLGSDGKQMNEHDMNLFQKVYGSGLYDEDEEEDDDDIENNHNSNYDEDDDPDNDNDNDDDNDNDNDNKFSRYIGEEISNNLPDKFGSSDDDSEDDDRRQQQYWNEINNNDDGVVDSQMGGHPYHEMSAGGLDDENIDIDQEFDDEDEKNQYNNYDYNDDDDYEDPNDDGQSYKKSNHPLYQADGSLRSLSNEKFGNNNDNDANTDADYNN